MGTRWYRSFYWRIGLGFILFLASMLAAQAVIGAWIVSRSAATLPGRAPMNFAALVATDLSHALAANPSLDVQQYIDNGYAQVSYPFVIVLRGGRIVMPARFPANEMLVRFARRHLDRLQRGDRPPEPFGLGRRPEPAIAPATIIVDGEVRGVVVVPPRAPLSMLMRQLGPALGAVAVLLLAGGTALAAFAIFNPARRRLRSLEEATSRLGTGDLSARAAVKGGDEIASVAQAFNAMADELSARAQRLDEEDRRRRQLLADVSHELGTPLTAIRGYIETLTMPGVAIDPPTRERYLGIINDETMRLGRIVADLLDLARLESGGSSITMQDVEVARLFDRVVARHERVSAEQQVPITTSIGRGAETVHGDPDRLEQALQNLAANALRHTPAGGTVQLCASRSDQGVVLAVTDAGDGIPREHLPHIFDRFYKADQARASGPTSGSGLGLSIVKAIAERHAGRVSVESQPGRTVFSIVLPN